MTAKPHPPLERALGYGISMSAILEGPVMRDIRAMDMEGVMLGIPKKRLWGCSRRHLSIVDPSMTT